MRRLVPGDAAKGLPRLSLGADRFRYRHLTTFEPSGTPQLPNSRSAVPHVHVTAADSVGCRVNHGGSPSQRIPNANCHLDNTIDSINDRVVGSARVQKFVLNGQVGVASHDDVGNPFFTEEMVRELVQRGVLAGEHGKYVCRGGCRRGERAGHGAGGYRSAYRPR